MKKVCIVVLILSFFTFFQSTAQTKIDSTTKIIEIKTLSKAPFPDSIFKFSTKTPSPKRAGLYSALLPGLGQVYNKQYWKVGLVAAGAGIITGFVISNSNNYQKYQKAYIYRIDNNPDTPILFPEYTSDDLNQLRKGYRKYTEYTVIAATVGYLVNILDAYISGHLKSFDMSKDISLKTKSYFDQGQMRIGIAVVF